jgi:MFS family permease
MTHTSPPAIPLDYATEQQPQRVGRLTFYFGLVYFCQGITQYVNLINQPVRQLLRKEYGYNVEQLGNFVFYVGLPWVIKPVYGLISDFIPLLGYRRKSYLLLLNFLAAGAFLYMTGITRPAHVLFALFMTGVGVAASDVIVDALMVEAGQATGRVRLFQGVQWLCINVAGIGSGVLSMIIIARFSTIGALRAAAIVCAAFPLLVAALTWWAVREKRSKLNLPQLKDTAEGLFAALTSLRLWMVLAFLLLTVFNPGIVTPMYDHVMRRLGVDESFNSVMDTVSSIGMTLGSSLFLGLLVNRFSTRTLIAIGLLSAAVGMVPFFFITGKTAAWIAYLSFGCGYMLATLASLSLAAEACPRRAEGFVFAAMMSLSNLSMNYSDKLGSTLYEGEGYFHHNIHPLIGISIVFTLAGLLLLPFLPTRPVDSDAQTTAFGVLRSDGRTGEA